MDTLSYKTVSANKATVKKEWLIVDAENQSLGRLSAKVASLLRGKHKPSYTPHVDCGDNIIIINAEKIALSGNKWTKSELVSYTGYPGGQKWFTPLQLYKKDPVKLVEHAIKGMLPKNKLGRELFRNLRVVIGTEHDHQAQNPKVININDIIKHYGTN